MFTGALVLSLFLDQVDVEGRVAQGQQHGGGYVDGRSRAHHHADEHSQGKVVDDAAAQQEQGKRGQKGGAAGEDGA